MDEQEYLDQLRKSNPELFDAFTEEEILQIAREKTAAAESENAMQPEKPLAIRPEAPEENVNPWIQGGLQGATASFADELGLQDIEKYRLATAESPWKTGGSEIAGAALTGYLLKRLGLPGLQRLLPVIQQYPKLATALGVTGMNFLSGAGAGEQGEKLESGAFSAIASPMLGYGIGKTISSVGSGLGYLSNPKNWKNASDYFRYKALGGSAGTPTQSVMARNIGSQETPYEFRERIADITRENPQLLEASNRSQVVKEVLDKYTKAKQQILEYAKEKGLGIPLSELNQFAKKGASELDYLSNVKKPLESFKKEIGELGTIQKDISRYKPAQVYYDKEGKMVPGLPVEDLDKLRTKWGKKTFDYSSGESDPYNYAYGQIREKTQRALGPKGQEYSDILSKINATKAAEDIINYGDMREIANRKLGLGNSSLASAIKPTGNISTNIGLLGLIEGLTKYGAGSAYPATEAIQSGLEAVGKPFVAVGQSQLGQKVLPVAQQVLQESRKPLSRATGQTITKKLYTGE